MNNQNNGKYIVGNVKNFIKRKGWFFGHFAENPLLQSNLVEIAWQDIANKTASAEDKHFHRDTVEINIVMSGSVHFIINGESVTVAKGQFWVVWPETIIEQFSADAHASLVVVRAPSIEGGGKIILK